MKERKATKTPDIDEPDDEHPEPQTIGRSAAEQRRAVDGVQRRTGTGPKE